jgi:hypothetical protein
MKSLIAGLVLTLSVSAAHATDWGLFTVQVTVAQTIAVVVQQTFYATTRVSSDRSAYAKQIQNDVQDYNQIGYVSPVLAERIAFVQAVNPELSEQESVDVLLIAAESILN